MNTIISILRHKNYITLCSIFKSKLLFSTKVPFNNDSTNMIRQKIEINHNDLEFKQVKGGGPGGQATNKTNNCIVLKHKPTGIMIKCHASRDTETNKNYAIKRLKEKLDEQINGELSKKAIKEAKKKKQKDRRARKSEKKYNNNKEKKAETNDKDNENHKEIDQNYLKPYITP